MLQEPAAAADADHVRKLHALEPASTALASAACASEHGHEPIMVRLHAMHAIQGICTPFVFITPQRLSPLGVEECA